MPLSVTLCMWGDLSRTRVFSGKPRKSELCTDLSEKKNTLKGTN